MHAYPRTITDAQIKAVAAKGGVIGIAGVPKFIGEMTLDAVAKHVMHAIDVAGMDHVCFGTDFGAMTAPALIPDFQDMNHLPQLVQQLRRLGLHDADLDKMTHLNVEGLLRETLPS